MKNIKVNVYNQFQEKEVVEITENDIILEVKRNYGDFQNISDINEIGIKEIKHVAGNIRYTHDNDNWLSNKYDYYLKNGDNAKIYVKVNVVDEYGDLNEDFEIEAETSFNY